MKTTDRFVLFWDGIYSNWHPAPIVMDGIQFANSEQAFMWLKARYFDDEIIAVQIAATPDPAKAKKLGRLIKGYDDVKWCHVRFETMYQVCLKKFSQNPELAKELLATGDRILVEASPADRIWGIGLDQDSPLALEPQFWQGMNLLGEALMKVRESLRTNLVRMYAVSL
jgi:ribA/ribD-fused uncharacterized protein